MNPSSTTSALASRPDWKEVIRHPLVQRVQQAVDGTIVHVRRVPAATPGMAHESLLEPEEEA